MHRTEVTVKKTKPYAEYMGRVYNVKINLQELSCQYHKPH